MSVFIPIPNKGNGKGSFNHCTFALISHTSKVLLKIKLHMFKLDLEKAEKPEIKLPASVGLLKRQGNSRKTSNSASLTMLKPLTVWITTNHGKLLKEMEIPDHLTAPCETCMRVKK